MYIKVIFIKLFLQDISDNDLQSYGAELMCETLEEDDVVVSLKASGMYRIDAEIN